MRHVVPLLHLCPALIPYPLNVAVEATVKQPCILTAFELHSEKVLPAAGLDVCPVDKEASRMDLEPCACRRGGGSRDLADLVLAVASEPGVKPRGLDPPSDVPRLKLLLVINGVGSHVLVAEL